MSVAEAAELLGLTIRRVQQLARELGGRRIGHHWRLDRGLVLAHKNFRDYRRDEETDG
jgi:excisionase family DNA binding protein